MSEIDNNDIETNVEKIRMVKMRYHNETGSFAYDKAEGISINDRYIVQVNDDVELATVVCFQTCLNTNKTQDTDDIDASSENPHSNSENKNGGGKNNKKKKPFKRNEKKVRKILHKCSSEDYQKYLKNQEDEKEAFKVCKEKIEFHKLNIKLVDAHYSFNRAKLLFEFVSEIRIDFRELVKDLASHFHTRIELRQIGVRDEARVFGGCSICGRELCCNVMKSNFETITIKMAKDQNMPLNTAKISGQCGRLMCCIYYEYNTYRDIKKDLPPIGSKILFNNEVAVIRDINLVSRNFLIETDDRRLMYVKIPDLKNKKNNMIVVESEKQ